MFAQHCAKANGLNSKDIRMDLPQNAFKRAITSGQHQLGLWCGINDSLIIEMLAGCGYDWLLLDTEHAALETHSVVPLLQAAAAYPVSTLVRPTHFSAAENKKYLDFGAQTLVVPYIQSADEARAVAASVTYAPAGIRGVAGSTRASRFGAVKDYHAKARDEICLIVQVETAEALEELDAITGVDGVDGVFIGPSDLAASMGYPGQANHPEVRKTVIGAIKRIRAAGKPAGLLALDQAFAQDAIDAGSLFTAVGVESVLLRDAAADLAKAWREKL